MGPTATLSRGLRDTLIITKRNLIRYVRLPQLLFFSFIQPIMFILLFNFVFGGALIGTIAGVPGGKYIDYLLPGILIQLVMFGGVQTGIGLAEDMSKGIIDRFRALPMSRIAVIAGRTLSDTARNLMSTLVMIGVGSIIGFRFHNGFGGAVMMIVLLLLFGFAFSWVFAFIGMAVKDSETAQLASFVFIFPLTFASAAFVSVATMTSWLQVFARNQPVTLLANAGRHFALGIPAGDNVRNVFIWIIGILVIFIPLSIWQYQRRNG
jgi:ABC transporter DrrB family efflux protein